MCFSVQVDKDLKKLSQRFNAMPSREAYLELTKSQALEKEFGPEYVKTVLGLKRKPRSTILKEADDSGRIYPGYWTNIVVAENGQRVVKPMRYRVRPANSKEEIPSKYNVFNCRIDALDKRQTWKNIFMKNHGIFPFIKFFEWIDRDGKKSLIKFNPKDLEIMWAPVIFDRWESPEGISFYSFALITDDPPPEIEQAGHDRCPIFLSEKCFDDWLCPEKLRKAQAYELLKQRENVFFVNEPSH